MCHEHDSSEAEDVVPLNSATSSSMPTCLLSHDKSNCGGAFWMARHSPPSKVAIRYGNYDAIDVNILQRCGSFRKRSTTYSEYFAPGRQAISVPMEIALSYALKCPSQTTSGLSGYVWILSNSRSCRSILPWHRVFHQTHSLNFLI